MGERTSSLNLKKRKEERKGTKFSRRSRETRGPHGSDRAVSLEEANGKAILTVLSLSLTSISLFHALSLGFYFVFYLYSTSLSSPGDDQSSCQPLTATLALYQQNIIAVVVSSCYS